MKLEITKEEFLERWVKISENIYENKNLKGILIFDNEEYYVVELINS